jgi:hypothetical protein
MTKKSSKKMKEFVVILSEQDRFSLMDMRTLPKVQAAVFVENDTPNIWLRGIFGKEKPSIEIQKLPIQQLFVLKEGLLFPINGLTPLSKLPLLTWQLLTDFMPIELPTSAFPAVVEATTAVHLVVSEQEQKGVALLTAFKDWLNYVETAPDIRLQQLKFAASDKEKVLIMGDVLPPIQGQTFWQDAQVLIPCGQAFEWAITARLLSKKYKLTKTALLLFSDSLEVELPQRIDLENFVNASRSAVRFTQHKNSIKN